MTVADAKHAAKGPWVEWAGRLGLVSKGAIYAVVALLAMALSFGVGGKAADRQGALRTIASAPLGEALLLALAAGFAGYAIWRFVQAFLDRDDEGSGPKALAKRAGYLGRGLLYAATCLLALALVVGVGSGGSNEKEETAKVLDLPAGRWIVAGIGLAFLVGGAYNLYRSLTGKFRKDLREYQMNDAARPWAIVVGVLGHAARAVVFSLIGIFLLRAAIQYDAREAIGIDGALRKLAQQEYGEFLLGVVATGLLAYALFCFVQARYRRV
ncbi:MAG: DUF1206 domain-containing protein [Gaiellaceae bacterium]